MGFTEGLLIFPLTIQLVEQVPNLLTPYTEEILVRICLMSQSCRGAPTHHTANSSVITAKLMHKLSALAVLLYKRVQPRVLMPAIRKCFIRLLGSPTTLGGVRAALEVLEGALTQLTHTSASQYLPDLLIVLTQGLSLRHRQREDGIGLEPELVTILEQQTIEVSTKLVLKLDEATNLSLFSKVKDWALSTNSTAALTSFYRYVHHLAKTLKVLFIKCHLADRVYNHALDTLTKTASLINTATADTDIQSVHTLIECVLGLLTEVFSQDSVGFTTENRFSSMVDPVIQQLCSSSADDGSTATVAALYRRRTATCLTPCILALCTASRNDAQWADLNSKMLMLLRTSSDHEVMIDCTCFKLCILLSDCGG